MDLIDFQSHAVDSHISSSGFGMLQELLQSSRERDQHCHSDACHFSELAREGGLLLGLIGIGVSVLGALGVLIFSDDD